MVNLKQLSEHLGLSQTTVSRALGGYPEVKAATRELVQEAARTHHYKPSRRATSLATGRSMAIGHVIPMSSNHEMVNPVFADFVAGAGEIYASAGYDMLVSVVNDRDELRAYRDLASKSAVDGVIVHGPVPDDARIKVLDDVGLPFVVHGRAEPQKVAYSYVDIDNQGAFRAATDLLLDLGHARIALLNGVAGFDFTQRRDRGYAEALEARGREVDPDLMVHSEMTEHFGFDAAMRLLAGPNPPTAFLVSSIMVALGVHRALGDLDLKIGRDISVVSHDDVLSYIGNGGQRPLFTATRSSVRAAGRRCAELLLARIKDPGSPCVQEIWDVALQMGQSTGSALPAQRRRASAGHRA